MSFGLQQASVSQSLIDGHREIQLFDGEERFGFASRPQRLPTEGWLIGTTVGKIDAIPLAQEPTKVTPLDFFLLGGFGHLSLSLSTMYGEAPNHIQVARLQRGGGPESRVGLTVD